MSDWKYIVVRTGGEDPHDVPIVFPGDLIHADIADALGLRANVVSAGHITGLQVLGTGGNSTTLGVSGREADADMINTYSYSNGRADMLSDMPKLCAMAFLKAMMDKLGI